MSILPADELELIEIRHLDDRTKLIVRGFIRERERLLLLSHNNNQCYNVPLEITTLCLLFVDTHFIFNCDSYEWKINNQLLLERILSSDNKELFESSEFSICKLKWKLQLFPNGHKIEQKGNICIFLKSITLPLKWKNIIIQYMIKFKETNTKF